MDIATKLKDKRKQLGFTQEEISNQLRVSRQTISNWETGKSVPDIYNLIALSDLYSLTLDELIKEDIKMVANIKRESKEKKYLKVTMLISVVGLITFGLSFLMSASHLTDFLRGFSVGMWIISVLIFIVIKMNAILKDINNS